MKNRTIGAIYGAFAAGSAAISLENMLESANIKSAILLTKLQNAPEFTTEIYKSASQVASNLSLGYGFLV